MHCLRHLAILFVLVPFPARVLAMPCRSLRLPICQSTSPYLLLLVAMVAYMAVRPCGYCLATLAVVFFSTSPSSPFLAALGPESEPALAPLPNPNRHLSSPIPDRGAFFLNGGRIFDPILEGYAAMQKVWESQEAPKERPLTAPTEPLPKWYHDMRLGGVGLVLDFGWRRTDEGLAWELAQQKRAAEMARYRGAERQRPAEEASASRSRQWLRLPFVGTW